MKALKIVGIVLAVFILLIGGIVALVMGATRGLPAAADAFFKEIAAGRVAEAYANTATEFKAATSLDDFAAFLSRSALDRYENGRWSSRSIENNRGTLKGTATTRDGGEIPLTVEFVKEGGVWKVLTLRKAAAGLQPDSSASPEPPAVPDEETLSVLTREAFALFADAVAKDDFTAFHRSIGPMWQRQFTPQQLRDAFAVFIERQIDLRPLVALAPQFGGPATIDDDGVLTVEGSYDSNPPVSFRLKFLKEQGRWQLLGVNVRQ